MAEVQGRLVPGENQMRSSLARRDSVANCALAPHTSSTHYPAFRMLTISGLSKAFGGRTLFAEVSLQVNRQDRIGLVGPNGAGKTTLFSFILGNETPDQGTILFEREVTVGYLPQESAPAGDETVLELATAISAEQAGSLPRQLRRVPGTTRGERGASAGGLQEPTARNREVDGIRGPLSRQEHQGGSSASQAQANRAHGESRSAGRR